VFHNSKNTGMSAKDSVFRYPVQKYSKIAAGQHPPLKFALKLPDLG